MHLSIGKYHIASVNAILSTLRFSKWFNIRLVFALFIILASIWNLGFNIFWLLFITSWVVLVRVYSLHSILTFGRFYQLLFLANFLSRLSFVVINDFAEMKVAWKFGNL